MKEAGVDYKICIWNRAPAVRESASDIRVLYVVDGECTVYGPEGTCQLSKADVLLLNSGVSAPLDLLPGAMLAVVSIDYFKLCSALGLTSLRFYLNSQEDTGQKYTQVKSQLQNLLMAYVGEHREGGYQELGCFYLLLHTLVSHFLVKNEAPEEGEDQRVAVMLHYIHSSYGANLSLNEVAQRLYLSASSTSRLFQKATGEGFNSYVRKVRLEHVKQDLLETDHPITRVAVDNGFSTPSALNKIFKAAFGLTPSEYRGAHQVQAPQPSPEQEGSKERVLQILQEDQKLRLADLEQQETVRADVRDLAPWKKWENKLLNVGQAHVLSSANMQKHVLFLANQLEVEYLRVWDLFSSKLMVRGDGRGNYNFTFLDEILDFCVDNRLKLFIDLAPRKDVAMASEKVEIYSYDSRSTFESQEDWLDALENFLLHIRHRYHERVVGAWIFELSFFLNEKPYYFAEDYRSREVWEQGYQQIKKVLPTARVAGPGLATNTDREQAELLIDYFLSTPHAPDIFTSINFPYALVGEPGTPTVFHKQFRKTASRWFLDEQIQLISSYLKKSGFSGEYWVTEWGNSLANRNYIQDSCFRGAFVVENVLRSQEKVCAMGMFYASDLLNVYSDAQSILCGSAGLLSRNGICKPAYYAYRFLGRLGKYRCAQVDNCVVTGENPGDLRILCCNNKALGPKYYLTEENTYRPDELDRLFVNMDPQSLEIALTSLEPGAIYVVRQKILNREKGSILDKWVGFGCTQNLARSDLEYLEKISTPEIIAERMVALDGALHISFRMEPNEIRFITVTKE